MTIQDRINAAAQAVAIAEANAIAAGQAAKQASERLSGLQTRQAAITEEVSRLRAGRSAHDMPEQVAATVHVLGLDASDLNAIIQEASAMVQAVGADHSSAENTLAAARREFEKVNLDAEIEAVTTKGKAAEAVLLAAIAEVYDLKHKAGLNPRGFTQVFELDSRLRSAVANGAIPKVGA